MNEDRGQRTTFVRPAPRVAVVIPCLNEAAALSITVQRLRAVLEHLLHHSYIEAPSSLVLVDDGSTDRTWNVIQQLSKEWAGERVLIVGLRLARNFGHQPALMAGMSECRTWADAVVSIDADLQDDPEAISAMVHAYRRGADVVLGVRRKRDKDTAFKRLTARGFYWLMGRIGVQLVPDHADYRLLSASSLDTLLRHEERGLFLRSLAANLSARTELVHYDRDRRVAGESKYNLSKMIRFAWRGISANSIFPLRCVMAAGVLVSALSVAALGYTAVGWARGVTVPGWLSIAGPMYLLGGITMLSIGILGEYLGAIFVEVKRRPLYAIQERVGDFG